MPSRETEIIDVRLQKNSDLKRSFLDYTDGYVAPSAWSQFKYYCSEALESGLERAVPATLLALAASQSTCQTAGTGDWSRAVISAVAAGGVTSLVQKWYVTDIAAQHVAKEQGNSSASQNAEAKMFSIYAEQFHHEDHAPIFKSPSVSFPMFVITLAPLVEFICMYEGGMLETNNQSLSIAAATFRALKLALTDCPQAYKNYCRLNGYGNRDLLDDNLFYKYFIGGLYKSGLLEIFGHTFAPMTGAIHSKGVLAAAAAWNEVLTGKAMQTPELVATASLALFAFPGEPLAQQRDRGVIEANIHNLKTKFGEQCIEFNTMFSGCDDRCRTFWRSATQGESLIHLSGFLGIPVDQLALASKGTGNVAMVSSALYKAGANLSCPISGVEQLNYTTSLLLLSLGAAYGVSVGNTQFKGRLEFLRNKYPLAERNTGYRHPEGWQGKCGRFKLDTTSSNAQQDSPSAGNRLLGTKPAPYSEEARVKVAREATKAIIFSPQELQTGYGMPVEETEMMHRNRTIYSVV